MISIDNRFDAADLRTASTPDLLRLILGRTRAQSWFGLPQADLLQLCPIPQHPGCREPGPEIPQAPAVLLAAKEQLARSLHEDLARTYKGEATTIPAVTGNFCPACEEVVLNREHGNRYSDLLNEIRTA